eukprot:TRINITY_DN33953_c0_g1_i1.p1 TRINITY_DN33953_c0_g1~~TRINITY_DN33953_c0_g1_i1.p1  ORF type:complete len:325 (+),score=38.47 TRINITY_DN33953_c0_g1_i1:48-977(+)
MKSSLGAPKRLSVLHRHLCGDVASAFASSAHLSGLRAGPTAAVSIVGQVIVITGCTSGLGLNLAKEYIRLGHTVVGCGRRSAIIQELNKTYEGTSSSFHHVDVSSEPSVAAFAKTVEDCYGRVDVLICNAGLGGARKLPWEIPTDHVHSIIDVSLKGLMFTNKHFVPLMLRDLDRIGSAALPKRVINVSSGIAHTSMPWAADYCAVKCAVEGYSRCMAWSFRANEALKDRIICVPFAPGVVKTEMNVLESAAPADAWSRDAAPFILSIPAADNGSSVVMPGYYSKEYQATWIVPAGAKMNETFSPPEAR